MRKFKLLVFLILFAMISALIFQSCEKNEVIEEKVVETIIINEDNFPEFISKVEINLKNNYLVVDSFLEKRSKGNISKEDFLEIIEIMKIPKNIDVTELDKINRSIGLYELIEKNDHNIIKTSLKGECLIKSQNTTENKFQAKQKPTMCERCCSRLVKIRDAMLDECGKQVFGMSQVCEIGVTLAYWRRSSNC